MNKTIKKVVIVGGGSAGWLTAGLIAAEHNANSGAGIELTLVESPDVAAIGVGEGTWPTMRETLDKIGVSETDLFRECEASFKQGAKFAKWVTGEDDDFYYHPLVVPNGYAKTDLVFPWQAHRDKVSFADAVCYQGHLCQHGRAPKQITTPEYASVANYAYHLNAPKLGEFLKKHCINKLGVKHILDHVIEVNSHENGDIKSLTTQQTGDIAGDLFIDCSGLKSLLLGQHFQVGFVSQKSVLFNDSALAVQVPYQTPNEPIASHTLSTAQSAGWIWDIGLPTRRGIGYAYASDYIDDDNAARELRAYIAQLVSQSTSQELAFRKISFNPGHREKFWHKNCVAVGMAAGFLEPLEASALVLIELAASKISQELPANREIMDISAKRFNQLFLYRWQRIIDFLKLHYVLSQRQDSAYWRDNRQANSIPGSLQELIQLWRYQPPSHHDFSQANEVFPSASWQYILYGMGFETLARETERQFINQQKAHTFFDETIHTANKYLAALPSNRELINKILEHGLQKI